MSKRYSRFCDYCGGPFETTYPQKMFCRDQCRIDFNATVDRNTRMFTKAVRDSVREIVRAHHSNDPRGS